MIIIVTVTSGNNYVKEKQFRKLNAITSQKDVFVIRSAENIKISSEMLMVGDILIINTGDIILADGILIEGH